MEHSEVQSTKAGPFQSKFFSPTLGRRLSGRSWEDVEIEAYTYMLPRGATVTKG